MTASTTGAGGRCRWPRLGRLARREHEVVEDPGRQARLEQRAVDALQGEVTAEGELEPQPRDVVVPRARLDRAVEPAEPVRQQLFAAHARVREAGAPQ